MRVVGRPSAARRDPAFAGTRLLSPAASPDTGKASRQAPPGRPGHAMSSTSALATGLSLVSILLLDDDPTMRSAARNTLRAAAARPLQTWDGHDALEVIGSRHIDLVLCDCHAPMDGMTFLALRAHPAGVKLPAVS